MDYYRGNFVVCCSRKVLSHKKFCGCLISESFFSQHNVCVGNLKEPDDFYVCQRYISET